MGGRGGTSQARKSNSEYERAVELAKKNVKSKDKDMRIISQRILDSVNEYNLGLKKYEKQNKSWKEKVKESARLAQSGKLKESQKVFEEGKKIYESIPKQFRISK